MTPGPENLLVVQVEAAGLGVDLRGRAGAVQAANLVEIGVDPRPCADQAGVGCTMTFMWEFSQARTVR